MRRVHRLCLDMTSLRGRRLLDMVAGQVARSSLTWRLSGGESGTGLQSKSDRWNINSSCYAYSLFVRAALARRAVAATTSRRPRSPPRPWPWLRAADGWVDVDGLGDRGWRRHDLDDPGDPPTSRQEPAGSAAGLAHLCGARRKGEGRGCLEWRWGLPTRVDCLNSWATWTSAASMQAQRTE